MPDIKATADAIEQAASWDQRVTLIRQIPEHFGVAQHSEVYAEVSRQVYIPALAPDFAFIPWLDDYELPAVEGPYGAAEAATNGFTTVDVRTLRGTISTQPATLRAFRLIVGYTTQEFAAASQVPAAEMGLAPLTNSRVKTLEGGGIPRGSEADLAAQVVHELMTGRLFPAPPADWRRKQDKPDTAGGWATVADWAANGVPYPVFLHQRLYGGAFRQLLDATSSIRGGILEAAVEDLLTANGVPYVRTGQTNQEEIATRFGLTVRPAPDFVMYDAATDTIRAMLEAKLVNDGGTARDKAARYRALRTEGSRLGGVPVFAALAGLGWTRANDAMGPVVAACDGRVFSLQTLDQMLAVQPLPGLTGTVPAAP